MSKRYMEDHEHDAMVDSIRCRREETNPPLNDNPPPGPKWKAKQGLNRLNLNGAEHDVMGCLIDRASSKSGLCYPSEEFIAGWTGRPLRTIQRAIRTLWDKRLINITRRSLTSNRYFIQWDKLFAAYGAQKAFEKGRHSDANVTPGRPQTDANVTPLQKVAGGVTKSGGSLIQKVASEPSYSEPSDRNLRHEMAHQPSAADATHFSSENSSSLESLTTSPQVESPQGHSEEERVTLTPAGLTAAEKLDREIWTKWLRDWEAALKVCADPAERMRLGASIQRARSKLNEQRDETAASAS